MIATRPLVRSLAAVALLCTAAASQAAFLLSTTSRSAFVGASNFEIDRFSDLRINDFVGSASLTRSTGSVGYSVTTEDELYVVPAAGSIGLSVTNPADTLVFADFTSVGAVMNFGANFYGSNDLGESASGGLTIVATDINGLTQIVTLTGAGFAGFKSDVALFSVSARMTTPTVSVGEVNSRYVTADNVTFVPEPSSLALVLAAGFAIPLLRARRRA